MRKTVVFGLAVMLLAAVLAQPAQDEKPRLGVLRFTNNTSAGWWSSTVAHELSDMLASELASTKAFQVLERKEIDAAIYEQDLSQTDRISAATKVKLGKMKGAKYLVAGTVSAYEEQTRETGGGVRVGPVSLGGKQDKTYIAIDLKIIDTETGEIVDARTIEAESKGTGLGAGLHLRNFSVQGADSKKTPAGKAIRACVIYCSEYLACSLVKGQDAPCMKKWDKMEEKRRERTKGAIDIR
ncbi:MAG: penicillin-binding protein activator LpoB [Candidatus Aminicenantes bacterium]|nr:penicillin-binding protein activator LpoB [Candidatus Aminicenantes bacterium]